MGTQPLGRPHAAARLGVEAASRCRSGQEGIWVWYIDLDQEPGPRRPLCGWPGRNLQCLRLNQLTGWRKVPKRQADRHQQCAGPTPPLDGSARRTSAKHCTTPQSLPLAGRSSPVRSHSVLAQRFPHAQSILCARALSAPGAILQPATGKWHRTASRVPLVFRAPSCLPRSCMHPIESIVASRGSRGSAALRG